VTAPGFHPLINTCAHKCMVHILRLFSRLRLSIYPHPSAALGCCTSKAWALSHGCCITPRQRSLVPDDSSCILPFHVPSSCAAFSLLSGRSKYPDPVFEVLPFWSDFSPPLTMLRKLQRANQPITRPM